MPEASSLLDLLGTQSTHFSNKESISQMWVIHPVVDCCREKQSVRLQQLTELVLSNDWDCCSTAVIPSSFQLNEIYLRKIADFFEDRGLQWTQINIFDSPIVDEEAEKMNGRRRRKKTQTFESKSTVMVVSRTEAELDSVSESIRCHCLPCDRDQSGGEVDFLKRVIQTRVVSHQRLLPDAICPSNGSGI